MADNSPTAAGTAAPGAGPEIALQNIYVKDASFEAPSGPNLQVPEWNPQYGLNMNTSGSVLAPDMHEVILTITLEAKFGEKVAYLVEVKQAGVFLVRGYVDDDLRKIVAAFCPSVLFPYARQAVSDLVMRGGFPPFLLPPVNFDALLTQSLQQQQSAAAPPAIN